MPRPKQRKTKAEELTTDTQRQRATRCDLIASEKSKLSFTHLRWSDETRLTSVEPYSRTFRSVVGTFVPDFNAVDYAVVASKVDVPRCAARANFLTDLNLFAGAVVIVY